MGNINGEFVSEEDLVSLDLEPSPAPDSTGTETKAEVFTTDDEANSQEQNTTDAPADASKDELNLPEGIESVEQLIEEFNKAQEQLTNPKEDDAFKLSYSDISPDGLGVSQEDYDKAVEDFNTNQGKLSKEVFEEIKTKYNKSDAEMKLQMSAIQSLVKQAGAEIWEVIGTEGENIIDWAKSKPEQHRLLHRYAAAMKNPLNGDNLETAKLVCSVLRAKYEQEVGVEAKLITGEPIKTVASKTSSTHPGFKSVEEHNEMVNKLNSKYDPKLEEEYNQRLLNTTTDLGVDVSIVG